MFLIYYSHASPCSTGRTERQWHIQEMIAEWDMKFGYIIRTSATPEADQHFAFVIHMHQLADRTGWRANRKQNLTWERNLIFRYTIRMSATPEAESRSSFIIHMYHPYESKILEAQSDI